jgi:folate-dependent phosphoribosylglycinamide formyltransferase PurN
VSTVSHYKRDKSKPIRVVVFSGGPVLQPDVKQFISRLEQHPEIQFVAAFCQSNGQTLGAVWQDLWKRRRLLAVPLAIIRFGKAIGSFLTHPLAEAGLNRKLAELSDRIHFVPDIHSTDVLQRVRSLAPDLGLIYGSPILKPVLFEIPSLGTLGIHHGKAPKYRGKKTTFWEIYNGEKTAAVTIQKVNAGLDTGDILKQGAVTTEHRSYRAVCKELEELGIALYLQAIIEVQRGTATYSPQVGHKRKLCRDPKFADMVRFMCRQLQRRFKTVKQIQRTICR